MRFFWSKPRRVSSAHAGHEIAPDEIFLDSSNLPEFDTYQFEGRLERAISKKTLAIASAFFFVFCTLLLVRTWILQVKQGETYSLLSERNSLHHTVIFAPRGLIEDRNGVSLVSNNASDTHPEYPSRVYTAGPGFAHLLGYVEYPKKDSSGVYYRYEFKGKEGVEVFYDDLLVGENGAKITEQNVSGKVESESLLKPSRAGVTLTLSIDSRMQSAWYGFIKDVATTNNFTGGAGGLLDIETGEIIAMTSFPEFNSTVLSEGEDTLAIKGYVSNKAEPFLNRAVNGLYTPGSIVKPFLATGALTEKLIDPNKKILSTGSISIPNPFDPKKKSVFMDWRAHGWVDMRQALAVSSDVYFYEIGGGYGDQQGLGIYNIEKYLRLFGFGQANEDNFLLSTAGTLPNPEWKSKNFDGEIWRVGDTYNSAIGQYGMQVTPLQAVRGIAAVANDGKLLEPTVLKDGNQGRAYAKDLGLSSDDLAVVREGMRDAVRSGGTAQNINISGVQIAAKTGTAELDSKKQFVNSWIVGFFPYDKPRYAFAMIMEKGPHENTVGALYVMRRFFEWLVVSAPEYVKE